MPGKLTSVRIFALGLSGGLIPCLASALDMPTGVTTEQVDTANLGMPQDGSTARAPAGWTAQVGAYTDKAKADARLDQVAHFRSDELARAARLVTPLRWDDTHTVYRARFIGLSEEVAVGICASLNRQGDSCFASVDEKAASVSRVAAEPAAIPALRAGVVTADLKAALAGALDALAAVTPALREIVEQSNSPAPDNGAQALREIASLSEPPTVTGDVIAAAAAHAPILFANLAGAEPTKTMMTLAANDKASSPVSNAELSGMRGGFFTAGGAQFDFGASIKTMVNGQLALQTNLTWTPQGPNISALSGLGQQISNQVQSSLAQAGIGTGNSGNASNLAVNTPSSLNALGNAASNAASNPTSAASNIAGPATNLATGAVTSALNSAANTVNSAASAGAPTAAATPQTTLTIPTVTGVTIPGAGGGSTQILNNIGANQIQSILLNSASGQTITTNTNVMLTIYNLPQLQQQLAQHSIASQLAGEIMAASGLGH